MGRIRHTKQEEVLSEEIKKLTSFFTAEELFSKVHVRNTKIGIATVYRWLKFLVEQGEVHSYLCERKTIYSTNTKNHCHFCCELCGKKKHINLKNIGVLQEGIKGKMCHFQVDVTGICEECLKIGR
jgi:Fe2+ or Zn2+ uptake regulation protein